MLGEIAVWSSILGAVLAVPGLIFSVRAFLEAAQAKRASQRTEERISEVRSSLRNLAAAEELHQLSQRASELLLFVDAGQLPTGHYVARELRFDLNRAITRWDTLDNDVRAKLIDASEQLKKIRDFLNGRHTLTAEQKSAVILLCDDVINMLRSETGTIQAIIERH